jgi:hypothetical protein
MPEEGVVRDLVMRLSQGRDYTDILNLWIKQADGSVIRNPIRPLVNLDDYSTDFSLFEESWFLRPIGGHPHHRRVYAKDMPLRRRLDRRLNAYFSPVRRIRSGCLAGS